MGTSLLAFLLIWPFEELAEFQAAVDNITMTFLVFYHIYMTFLVFYHIHDISGLLSHINDIT